MCSATKATKKRRESSILSELTGLICKNERSLNFVVSTTQYVCVSVSAHIRQTTLLVQLVQQPVHRTNPDKSSSILSLYCHNNQLKHCVIFSYSTSTCFVFVLFKCEYDNWLDPGITLHMNETWSIRSDRNVSTACRLYRRHDIFSQNNRLCVRGRDACAGRMSGLGTSCRRHRRNSHLGWYGACVWQHIE